MSDDFDIEHINHAKAQEIIDWAISAAAMVILMDNAPEHTNEEEAMERLSGYIQAVEIMMGNMPEHMIPAATTLAQESLDEANFEEDQVEMFRAQLEDL